MACRKMVVMALVASSFGAPVVSEEAQDDPYRVVWTSPSADYNGSMPLGNGEVAVNAWVEPSGDLRFYLARTDSWGDNGRLLKIGSGRVHIEGGAATKPFRQALDVRQGVMTAQWGEGDERIDLRLWVDAHHPVVCVEVESHQPITPRASIELWRTSEETLPSVEVSDVLRGSKQKTIVEPDTILTGLEGRIGWLHHNRKSVGPALTARIQGVADFPRPDPLQGRTFGTLIATDRPQRLDDVNLVSTRGRKHAFDILVLTRHPSTPEEWLATAERELDAIRSTPREQRWQEHRRWWADFWDRSWVHITSNSTASSAIPVPSFPPVNKHPIRIGIDQSGGNRFDGDIGRVSIFRTALSDDEVAALAGAPRDQNAPINRALLYSGTPENPTTRNDFAIETFAGGFTLEAWIRPHALKPGRIIDKITPGGSDGFLLDTHPGDSVRLIVAGATLSRPKVVKANQWQHVAATVTGDGRLKVFLNGRRVTDADASEGGRILSGSDAFIVTRAYALQRYVAACAGRGRYPIKFNGSLFTVPAEGKPGDADYRRWGPGYWWQNTRLPYYSMCASGDFEMMQPLFRMYARDLMPLCRFRARRYLGHGGIYIPECIYFWGDVFSDTYGWQPYEEREDKLQASRWHKWEWVSGLELSWLLLDYWEHTQDSKFLAETVLPVVLDVLTFFDEHYQTGADGKLYMHPAQALETWWDCVNPMPEVAGLRAVAARLLRLPASSLNAEQRGFVQRLQRKLPDLPTTPDPDGRPMLAPAQVFKLKHNIENPELYAVFPFRLVAAGKPDLDLGLRALDRRLNRGSSGWRQDDIFMAYLGLADQAREYVVRRARSKHARSRFPAFWGPNYDWVPDQDHGSVLLKAVQAMLMQTDGREIRLLPAWPQDWDADFKLHAPYQTTVVGRVEKGRLVRLQVTPRERRRDVVAP